MAKGTVLVASPSAIGSTPVASGSSVPAWPAFCALNRCLHPGHGLRRGQPLRLVEHEPAIDRQVLCAPRHGRCPVYGLFSRRGRARPLARRAARRCGCRARERGVDLESQLRHEFRRLTRRASSPRRIARMLVEVLDQRRRRLRRRAAAHRRWRASDPGSSALPTPSANIGSSTSSTIAPRAKISASACRINSPTFSWRCEGLKGAFAVSPRCPNPGCSPVSFPRGGIQNTGHANALWKRLYRLRWTCSTSKHSMTSPGRMS